MKTMLSVLPLATLLWVSAAAAQQPAAAAPRAAAASSEQQEEANKRLVIEFYENAINKKDYEAAAKYLGDKYIQHNPTAADGPEGLRGFIEFLRARFPQQHNEIKHAYADGDTVILHVHSIQQPGTRGRAIVDIFRLDKGKVVEHWDVIQDLPDPAAARNSNGMF
jgi:predicted SnoaL-like aldol condensation-catalyzing enzyme